MIDEVKARGGVCIKLNPAWYKGIPDRLVILPQRIAFVELKRPKGGRLEFVQKWWKKRLTSLGHECQVLHTKEAVNAFLNGEEICNPFKVIRQSKSRGT